MWKWIFTVVTILHAVETWWLDPYSWGWFFSIPVSLALGAATGRLWVVHIWVKELRSARDGGIGSHDGKQAGATSGSRGRAVSERPDQAC